MRGREIVYGILAVAGLVTTWYFNLQYFEAYPGTFDFRHFLAQGFVNAAASSITMDLSVAFYTFVVFLFLEARRIGMRHAWAYLVLGFFVAFACAFPLFLLMCERHLRRQPA